MSVTNTRAEGKHNKGVHNSRQLKNDTQRCRSKPFNTERRITTHANMSSHSPKQANTPDRTQNNRADLAEANNLKPSNPSTVQNSKELRRTKSPAFNQRCRATPAAEAAVGPPCPPKTRHPCQSTKRTKSEGRNQFFSVAPKAKHGNPSTVPGATLKRQSLWIPVETEVQQRTKTEALIENRMRET